MPPLTRQVHVAEHRVQVAVEVADGVEARPKEEEADEGVVQEIAGFRFVAARQIERRPPQRGVPFGDDIFVIDLAARQLQHGAILP